MVRIQPFAAVRPAPGHESHVASPPYDVVTTAEARSIIENEPQSFMGVVRSEAALPEGTDPYDDAVYAAAKDALGRLLGNGALVRDDHRRLYLYRQVWRHHNQIGVVCCCHVEDYLQNRIRKHEKTRQAKEDDRTRHVLEVGANTGPVFLTHRDDDEVKVLVADCMNDRPLYHFNSPDGVTHTVWKIDECSPFVAAFDRIDTVYVADGHHRAASAARAAAERATANSNHTGKEEYNWFLTVLFPAGQLAILPYHRVVRDLNGLTPEEFLARLNEVGTVSTTDLGEVDRPGVVCVYIDGGWHRVELDTASRDESDPVAALDVARLQDRVLAPILGVGDPRTDDRIEFVGGIRGTKHLEKLVDGGEAAVAFSVHSTSIEELFAVADADLVMAPKSTWFEPKLRSGLLVHMID